MTSTTALEVKELPRRLTVLGANAVGLKLGRQSVNLRFQLHGTQAIVLATSRISTSCIRRRDLGLLRNPHQRLGLPCLALPVGEVVGWSGVRVVGTTPAAGR
ncbi:MAG: hypothetical protein GEV12_19905 [Micromonosporaceae bacterium]|nr:hypothetical protein [Micromonosporaceae bacterium]